MKLAVVGAGIAGVATAHELALDGHEVVVYERHQTVAEEGSFASAALLSAGWTDSLTQADGPTPPLAGWLGLRAGLQLAGLPGASQWPWLWQWLRATRAPGREANRQRLLQLARFGQERLNLLTQEQQLEHERQPGLLVLWRSEREQAQAQPGLRWLREQGVALRELTPEQARQQEPSLHPDTPLHAALELPGATAINGRQFALQLRHLAQQRGARFEFGCQVESLSPGPTVQVGLRGPGSSLRTERFDAVVVCAAMGSLALLKPLGLRLPLQPVWSHTLSAPVREALDAPLASVIDARHQISISRLGLRVRVAGGQRIGPLASARSPAQMRRLYQALADWFPGAARLAGPQAAVQAWHGARAAHPDGLPLVGESGLPGVWLSLAHGEQGWSTACGGARWLADRLQGGPPGVAAAAPSNLPLPGH